MRTCKLVINLRRNVCLCCAALVALPGLFGMVHANETIMPALGTPIEADALSKLPSHVFADGTGLPAGSGTAEQGKPLYEQHCAQCHGDQGQGGRALELVGDRSLLASDYPDRGIAVYWPNAPTLYEYIYRSMPPDNPTAFSNDELYALVAYLLLMNDLIAVDTLLDADALSQIQMPNESGFRTIGR